MSVLLESFLFNGILFLKLLLSKQINTVNNMKPVPILFWAELLICFGNMRNVGMSGLGPRFIPNCERTKIAEILI